MLRKTRSLTSRDAPAADSWLKNESFPLRAKVSSQLSIDWDLGLRLYVTMCSLAAPIICMPAIVCSRPAKQSARLAAVLDAHKATLGPHDCARRSELGRQKGI